MEEERSQSGNPSPLIGRIATPQTLSRGDGFDRSHQRVCVYSRAEAWGCVFSVAKWSVVPADIVAGHHWITILTAMFLHGSWSHILGNMVFLWAFGPEIEDAMNPLRYWAFYLLGGLVAMLAQVAASPSSTVPNLGASGAIATVMGAFLVTYPRDRNALASGHLHFCACHLYPGCALNRSMVSHPAL
jgi:hypothetical protein